MSRTILIQLCRGFAGVLLERLHFFHCSICKNPKVHPYLSQPSWQKNSRLCSQFFCATMSRFAQNPKNKLFLTMTYKRVLLLLLSWKSRQFSLTGNKTNAHVSAFDEPPVAVPLGVFRQVAETYCGHRGWKQVVSAVLSPFSGRGSFVFIG